MNEFNNTPQTLGMANMPKQQWCEPYDLSTALKEGTIFPNLNLTFFKAPPGESTVEKESNCSNETPQDREAAICRLTEVSFAVNDLTLYLDTHPGCEEGLALFYDLLEDRLQLLTKYADVFYPLTQTSMVTANYNPRAYGWAEGPMPWEGACI